MTTEQLILNKLHQLNSEKLQDELILFLDFLLSKQQTEQTQKVPQFGCAKGKIKMSENFDEPLEDFKDYMP
jgi:hypothetical protein